MRVEPPGGNHTSQIKTYPNPSNAGIHIVLKNDQGIKHLQVDVLNLKGELVKNVFSGEPLQSEMVLPWGGMDLDDIPVPSGVYIAKVSGPNMSHSKVFTIIQ